MASQSFDPRFGFDPVAAFLRRPLHEIVGEHTTPRTAPPPRVPRTVAGLRTLASQYAWLAVLDLSVSLLAEHDDHDPSDPNPPSILPHERLQIASFRILALLQTRQVLSAENALAELAPLTLHNRRYRYETYPQLFPSHDRGSFIPFELHALALEVRVRQGDATAIADCYALKHYVATDDSLPRAQRALREAQLLSALAAYHLRAQQHDAAVDVARQLALAQGGSARARYLYARVLLGVGDVDAAADVVHAATGCDGDCEALRRLHGGLLHAARERFAEAILEYDRAVEADETGEVWVAAGNNAAVCLVQVGRLAEAVDRLEGVLRREARKGLDEGVAGNLATLYDLACPQNSREKKAVLKKLAVRFGREGFDVACVKVEDE